MSKLSVQHYLHPYLIELSTAEQLGQQVGPCRCDMEKYHTNVLLKTTTSTAILLQYDIRVKKKPQQNKKPKNTQTENQQF